VVFGVIWALGIFAQTPPTSTLAAESGSSSMMGLKVEDSEDLTDAAKSELRGNGGGQEESASTEVQPLLPEEKPDIVIIRPPTLEERARIEREEIEMEKARRMLAKTGKTKKWKEASQVGQSTDADHVGATNPGGGGGDDGTGWNEADKLSYTKPPCLEDQAKMALAEIELAKRKGRGPGEGGGEGGGSGEGTGEGAGNGMGTGPHRTVKKICKSKNMYECLAEEAKERAELERNNSDYTEGHGGEDGISDGSSGEAEVKFKRPPVRFRTQKELELEAQKIINESTTPAVGEQAIQSDQAEPVSTVTVTMPNIEESARSVQSEIAADKESREAGAGGEVKAPPTKDLE